MIVGLLLRFLPYLIASAVVMGGAWAVWHGVQGWCNHACVSATARATTAEAKLAELDRLRILQQERWAQATAAEEKRAHERDEQRRLAFLALAARARSDRASAAIPIPSTSLGVLDDAHAAAEPARDPRPPKEASAPDSSAASVITWGVEILEWSAECKARVKAWEDWYTQLREKS